MMSPEPDKQQGKAIDDYYDCTKVMCSACGEQFIIPNKKLDLILGLTGICEKKKSHMSYLKVSK